MAGSFCDFLFGSKAEKSIRSEAHMSVRDAVNMAQTGNILLFRGWSPTSTAIQFFTSSIWSHIAMIIRLPHMNRGRPMVFEAIHSDDDHVEQNFKPLVDIKLRVPHCGVRLIDMEEYLSSIVTENRLMAKRKSIKRIKVVMRTLTLPLYADSLYDDFLQHLNTTAQRFIDENCGKHYETNVFEIALARIQVLDNTGYTTPDTLFCSELVGMFLLEAGLLDLDYTTPNRLLPDDFSATDRLFLRYPTEHLPSITLQVPNTDKIVKYSETEYIIDTVSSLDHHQIPPSSSSTKSQMPVMIFPN